MPRGTTTLGLVGQVQRVRPAGRVDSMEVIVHDDEGGPGI